MVVSKSLVRRWVIIPDGVLSLLQPEVPWYVRSRLEDVFRRPIEIVAVFFPVKSSHFVSVFVRPTVSSR